MFSRPLNPLLLLAFSISVLGERANKGALAEDTLSPSELNRLAGRVWTHGKEAPVVNALVTAIDVTEGFLMYEGPTSVTAHVPEEKFLWFFSKPNQARSGTVYTDAEGRFAVVGLLPGNYHVLIVHPERGMGLWRNITQPTSGDGLEAVLDPPTFVQGTVRGLPGPLEGLQAWLDTDMEMTSMQGFGEKPPTFIAFRPEFTLSPDGSFRAGPLPSAGEWTLNISKMVPARSFSVTLIKRSLAVQPGATTMVDIDLTGGGKIAGQVVDPSGQPLSDVAVQIRPVDHDFGALTDAEGRFGIGGLPDGNYRLEAKRWLARTGLG